MRLPVLLFLLFPLHSFAQYRPSYSPPRPSYTPAPSRPGPSPMQVQQRSQQQAHQTFQRMQAQQMQHSQQQQLRNQQQAIVSRSQQSVLMRRNPSQQEVEAAQALQQKSEQEANEKLAKLTQEQQRKRQEAPAQDPQLAAAQQKEDEKQLNLLTVTNYSEVFLPGQVFNALQARRLSPKARQDLQSINKDLMSNSWWSKQEGAQLKGEMAAYGSTLTSLTTELLGFNLASPPPPPAAPSASHLNEMLAKDTFDQDAATQLIREAALAEKLIAGERLARAVKDFNYVVNTAAAGPELQSDPKKLRTEVKARLRKVNTELQRYHMEVARSGKISEAQEAILEATYKYLAANTPAKEIKGK